MQGFPPLGGWEDSPPSVKNSPILYCIVLFFSMQHFGKLGINLNGLLVKVLDSLSKIPVFKTIGWLQVRLSLSFFRGR